MITRKQIEAYLKELTDSEHNSGNDDMAVFKNLEGFDLCPRSSLDVVICTTSAMMVAAKFKGKVYGYQLYHDTPGYHKKLIAATCGGHDFAVVGSYLIDWWARNVEGKGKAIYDLANPNDAAIVQRKYLPRTQWKRVPMWKKEKKIRQVA